MIGFAVLALALALAAIPAAITTTFTFLQPVKWTVGQRVRTTSGLVDGHKTSGAPEVSEYLGIPYARPPVGGLRFQAPVRYNGNRHIDGKNFVRFILYQPPSLDAND